MPVECYGKQFAFIGAPNRGVGDIFVVIAAENSTELFLDGSAQRDVRLPNAGDFEEYDYPTGK